MNMSETLNHKVWIWARGHLNKYVGRGECWDLADLALKHAGAHSSETTGENDDYVWGSELDLQSALLAGDILQFRNYVVTTVTVTEASFADGSGSKETETVTAERPHHTAILDARVSPLELAILEQNVPPAGKKVQRSVIPVSDLAPVITTTHKQLNDASGTLRPATVVKTVVKTVSGQLWVYRPQAKK
jgi:hypothetical protein